MSFPEFQRNAAGEPLLCASAVLYADVLGTSEHATAANAGSTLVALDAALRVAREQSDVDNTHGNGHVAWFSDNLAIAVPLDPFEAEASIGFAIVSAMWLQFELARRGYFLRGGLAVGNHYADDDFQFGPALVKAVELEHVTSKPRIALDDSTLSVAQVCACFHGELADNPFHYELAVEGDTTFISYLDGVAGEADDLAEVSQILELHRAALDTQLHHPHPDPVRAKYVWLAEYHNFVVGLWVAPDAAAELKLDVPTQCEFTRFQPPADLPADGQQLHALLAQLLP